MIEVLPDELDDADFTKIVGKLLNRFIESQLPKEIYVFKIDSWFDFKWRNFIGKYIGAAGFWNKEVLRMPPFIPDRVLEQRYFENAAGTYLQREVPLLHIYQSSSDNITGKRKLVTSGGTRMFCWFSGSTKKSLRGSLMVYHIKEVDSVTFYASFLKKETWQVYKTDGISRNEILSLI